MDSSHTILIREATIADAATLAQLRLMMFREIEYEPSPREAIDFSALCQKSFEEIFRSGICVAWFADVPGVPDPVGTLVMLTLPRLPTLGNVRIVEGYIINVYVVPARRRAGIASSLMQAAIDYAKHHAFARIRLRATEEGLSVYRRAGFQRKENVMELKL